MIRDPTQRATSIFNSRGRRRLVRRSILNVYDSPTKLQIRQQVKNVTFLLSVNPTTAMKQNQRLVRTRSVPRKIQIEFQFDVVCFCISNVGDDVVIDGGIVDPTIRIRLRGNRYQQI